MSEVPRVFISATSRDLGSCRKAVSDVLLTLNALPVLQDHFAPDYRTVVDMLRARIENCDAVICLVGGVYGQEPLTRATDQPRRSYTQLEYDIAVELRKPVFVFIATDDCPGDNTGDQPEDDELRGLQLEHLKRLVGSDRLWMRFRSREDLIAQVRVMRFDRESLAQGVTTRLAVLMTVELVDSDSFRDRQGDVAWARDVLKPYHDRLRQVLVRWKGTVQSESPAECQVNFEAADAAVNAALDLHHALRLHDWALSAPWLRIGIDMGQVVRFGGVDDAHVMQAGQVLTASRHLAQLGRPGQTLLSRAAFDSAREHVRQLPFPSEATASELGWESYGRYVISGSDEPLDVCEVGVKGEAPLAAPGESDQVQRADSLEERQMRGWRPGIKQEIPRRPAWSIERKLGEGGFGEVWIARHEKTREVRVFKFCFDAARLSSFKRELTLFRLLRDALGNRPDIARLLEVELDQAPFFLESEYVEGGNLGDWSEAGNRLAGLPLDERLRLMAAIARAVAAAHSVGIIHKDLKPSNIFMRPGSGGRWQPILADFGIGAVADRSLLEQRGITVAGFTQSLLEPGSSRTGTRMYQPPEASLAGMATVQGDVYALGVMLFQIIVGDFDQPLGVGWERRLETARVRGFGGGSISPEPGIALAGGTGPESAPVAGTKPPPLPARDPRNEVVLQLLKEDINDCVIDDPAQRLASVAQLAERLETLDARVATGQARRRAERAALRMRRLRVALAASLVALVLVGGLAAFALTQWRRAEGLKKDAVRNEKKAEENARQARASAEAARQQSQLALGTLSAVIFDIQRGLQNLPGSSPIRSRLLGTALKQLEKLSGEYVQHSAVDRETAVALDEMGDLILQLGIAPGDGRGEGARELSQMDSKSAVESARRLYTRSLVIWQILAKADPNDAQAKRDLSISYEKLGDVHLRLGATDKALDYYQKNLELREALAKADPNDAQAKRDLSFSYDKLGDVHLRLGATDKALESYRKSLELREALAKADPNDARAKSDLTVSYDNLGGVHLRLGATDKALESYRKGLELREALAKADPNDARAKRDLAVSYDNLGHVHLRLGATDKALESYGKGLELREALAKADPNDARAKRDLAVSYDNLGDVHLRLGATDKALESYRKGLELWEALAKADPNDAQAKRDLALSYSKLGDVHLRLGAADKALESYRKGLELREALAKADPNDAQAKSDLALSYDNVGGVHLRLGATDKALESYRKGLELREALAKADSNDARAKRDLAVSDDNLGDVHLRLGATDKALESYRKGLELWEALAKADPIDAQAKRDLSVSHLKLGDVHLQRGVADKALESYRRGLELNEALAKSNPTNVEAQQDLSYSCFKIGEALERTSDPAQARGPFEKSLAIYLRLSELMPRSASTRREVAAICERLSTLCRRIKDGPAAVSYARQTLEHARAARGIAGANEPFQWNFSSTFERLGDAQQAAGQIQDARQSYEEAIKIEPKSITVRDGLAWLLATSWDDSARDGNQAIELATKTCELTEWKNPFYFDTVAAAYAEAGRFEDAVKWQRKAVEHPEAFPAADIEELKKRLKTYESGKPYHQTKPEAGPSAKDRPQPK